MTQNGALVRTAALVLLLAGCAGQPPATSSPVPSASSSPTSAPTAEPTSVPTAVPSVEPTGIWELLAPVPPNVFFQAQKNELIMGGHGTSPDITLPASIAVDYRVSGTCTFSISITATGATDPAARFDRKVNAETVQSTWLVTLDPGSYAVGPSDANGCTWIVTVRAGA